MPTVLKLLGVGLALYAGYCALLFLIQRQVVFPRHLIATPLGGSPPVGVERVALPLAAGEVEAWYIVAAPNARPGPAIVFGHGNGELIDDWAGPWQPLARRGIGVLLVEYPGYGRSRGRPSQASVTRAFVAAHDWLASRPEVDRTRIVGVGRSLGGGAVCQLAQRRPLAALVLMSTFTSARALAGRFLAPGFLVRDPFDNLAVVRRFDGPVLVVHGRHDDIIPPAHGERLAAAAAQGRRITYACRHNDCPPDWDRFVQELHTFLRAAGMMSRGAPTTH